MIRENTEVEWLAISEAGRLARRDVATYAKVLAGLYICPFIKGISLSDARLARSAYFYARHIDDALDGEHSRYPDLSATPDELPMVVDRLAESNHPAAKLGRHAIKGLKVRAREGDDPVVDMQRLMDSMIFDYDRTKSEALFEDEGQLESYFSDAMRGVNLMLIGFGSHLREDVDIPDLANGIGRVYSARYLSEDWVRGTINIPSVELRGVFKDIPSYDELIQSEMFPVWQSSQLDKAATELEQTRKVVAEIRLSDPGARVVGLLADQALSYIPDIRQSFNL